jgi:pimeloyl-ACP methyl ester carboxylesterase
MASTQISLLALLVAAILAMTAARGQTPRAEETMRMHRFEFDATYSTLMPEGALEEKTTHFAADSGSLAVKERRGDPESRSILIPVRRILATGVSPAEPLFHLSGGPGQSNLRSFDVDYFIERHDHVMVGYRGVDGGITLDCPEVVEAIKASGDLLSTDAFERVSRAFGECSSRLISSGVDLSGYTVAEVADDIESARRRLGYDKISLVAESFGTRIALVYAMKYPDAIKRMILIGVNPPGHMVWDPYQSDSLLMRYAELWSQDSASSARYPDLIDAFQTVHRDMPDHWLVFPIHEGTVKASVFTFLFHRESAAMAFDAYVAAAEGDPSGLWLISAASAYIYPDIVNWGDNASKAVSADYQPERDYVHEMMPEDAILGAPLGSFLWAPAQGGRWPIEPIPQRFRAAQPCSVETLFLNGSLDFSTPAVNTERELMPLFPHGRHVVLREMGHVNDLWHIRPARTKALLVGFLEEGTVPNEPLETVPMHFAVGLGYPTIAKLLVAGGVFAMGLLITAVIVLIRRVRRRFRLR